MTENHTKENLKQKFAHEMWMYLIYALFLALFFGAFTTYRKMLLEEYSISYVRYGYAIVESLILAKVILLGQTLGLGQKFKGRPLVFVTMYKTVIFTLFVLAFMVLEHFVVGFFHGKDPVQVFHELIGEGKYEIFAKIWVMFFVFILFFRFLRDMVCGGQ